VKRVLGCRLLGRSAGATQRGAEILRTATSSGLLGLASISAADANRAHITASDRRRNHEPVDRRAFGTSFFANAFSGRLQAGCHCDGPGPLNGRTIMTNGLLARHVSSAIGSFPVSAGAIAVGLLLSWARL
jgi:hypothetical protein